jgi:hypothetical protein
MVNVLHTSNFIQSKTPWLAFACTVVKLLCKHSELPAAAMSMPLCPLYSSYLNGDKIFAANNHNFLQLPCSRLSALSTTAFLREPFAIHRRALARLEETLTSRGGASPVKLLCFKWKTCLILSHWKPWNSQRDILK